MKTFLTRKEAAARARVCTRTIDRAILANDLRIYRIGAKILTTDEDVIAWIERHASDAPQALAA